MLSIHHFEFEKNHRYCIYIQPDLFSFLERRSKGNYQAYLEYLIQKYKQMLILQKKIESLKKSTCSYQPKTKNYKSVILKNITPELWRRLKTLKATTGYSISFIIRIFIEWEMQNENISVEPLIPQLPEYRQQINYQNFPLPLYNYTYCQWVDRRSDNIFFVLWDFP
ncbi:MAG: hypothetical protein ACK4UJ_04830 [Leptonema sp. (in: bacteria)]